jgi:hypothetical protein
MICHIHVYRCIMEGPINCMFLNRHVTRYIRKLRMQIGIYFIFCVIFINFKAEGFSRATDI